MDFEQLLSAFQGKTCVMSVEAFPDGHYGNIRIVAGNQAHCDDMLQTMHRPFVPGSPYEAYFPQDKNFEDFCCRCAMQGQALHSYVRLPQMDLWLNMILLPLRSDRENIGYCVYSYDVTPFADAEQRTSLSADTSSAVLQTCLKLRDSGSCGIRGIPKRSSRRSSRTSGRSAIRTTAGSCWWTGRPIPASCWAIRCAPAVT